MKKFSIKPHVNRPTPSLRLAFWGLIVTSGLYWALALIIGSSLLTSCSGSIFTDTSKPPMSNEFAHPPGEVHIVPVDPNRGLVEGSPQSKDEIVSSAEIETYAVTPAIKLYRFLFPGTLASLLEGLDKSQTLDALARLRLDITIQPKIKTTKKIGVTRKVDIQLLDASKVIGKRSLTVTPTQDLIEGTTRRFFADGILVENDRNITTLLQFDFSSNGALSSGKIMKYLSEGEERDTFVLDLQAVTVKIVD